MWEQRKNVYDILRYLRLCALHIDISSRRNFA